VLFFFFLNEAVPPFFSSTQNVNGMDKQKNNVFSFQGENNKKERILLFTLLHLFSFLSRFI